MENEDGYWDGSVDNLCLRCDSRIVDPMARGMVYCWPCRREGSRNSGLVGPIFSSEWC